MLRLGLCCLFVEEPIAFRTTTARALRAHPREEQLARLGELCLANARSLEQALRAVHRLGIGAFRVQSGLLPRLTHPEVGYEIDELPTASLLRESLSVSRSFALEHGIRLSLHPDQFVVLSSPSAEVVESSCRELGYQGTLAEAIGAEVITLHGGGGYGDKPAALRRLGEVFATLSPAVRDRLALENDDLTYTVRDLAPICAELAIPLVYDLHHHRCNPDGLSLEEATRLSLESWERLGREPFFHLSSPRNPGGDQRPHADRIRFADLPRLWLELEQRITVDVEAKEKELAVLALQRELDRLAAPRGGARRAAPR